MWIGDLCHCSKISNLVLRKTVPIWRVGEKENEGRLTTALSLMSSDLPLTCSSCDLWGIHALAELFFSFPNFPQSSSGKEALCLTPRRVHSIKQGMLYRNLKRQF